jgi:hypothetical protein
MSHRRIALTHGLQRLFGRNAPIHDPDTSGLTVLRLDFLQEPLERRSVAGVARHDFIGQRKTFGTEHHRDDHLPAVRTFVPTVAVLGFGRLLHFPLEIRAGQVIEQQVIGRAEEIFPARLQVREERRPVFVNPIQTFVEAVLGRDGEILVEQLVHRAANKPPAVRMPLAARSH